MEVIRTRHFAVFKHKFTSVGSSHTKFVKFRWGTESWHVLEYDSLVQIITCSSFCILHVTWYSFRMNVYNSATSISLLLTWGTLHTLKQPVSLVFMHIVQKAISDLSLTARGKTYPKFTKMIYLANEYAVWISEDQMNRFKAKFHQASTNWVTLFMNKLTWTSMPGKNLSWWVHLMRI